MGPTIHEIPGGYDLTTKTGISPHVEVGASSACTARFTTPSTFNATSSPDPPCGFTEPKLLQSGAMRLPRHDAWQTWLSICALQSCCDRALRVAPC
jgi:hypothetical protein